MAKEEEISENLLKVLKGLNKKETEDKISVSKIKKKIYVQGKFVGGKNLTSFTTYTEVLTF